VEQDPKEILSSVYHCMEQTLNSCKDLKINPADIKGKCACQQIASNEPLQYTVLLNFKLERWDYTYRPYLTVIF